MKDLLGNRIKEGDILLELQRGFGSLDDYKYHMKIWEMLMPFDGHAYYYSIDGSRHIFAWAHLNNAIKIDINSMPDDFEYSFKHGMTNIASKIEQGTQLELIENSNWETKKVKKEDVENFEFLKKLKINSIDDIKNNIDKLKKSKYISCEIISKVLKIIGTKKATSYNGEIGIATMYDHLHFIAIIKTLDKCL